MTERERLTDYLFKESEISKEMTRIKNQYNYLRPDERKGQEEVLEKFSRKSLKI